MLFPHKDEVLRIHQELISRFGGLHGIRDERGSGFGLDGGGESRTLRRCRPGHLRRDLCLSFDARSSLLDGNKRAGAAVAEIFIKLNGASLSATNDEVVD